MVERSSRLELIFPNLYPRLVSAVLLNPSTLVVNNSSAFKNLVYILKCSFLHRFYLQDFTALDHLYLKRRFELQHQFISYLTGSRIQIQSRTSLSAPSLDNLFLSANWLEREVFDMFGVCFFDRVKDSRRILTDYNFNSHPLQKDFPVSGFFQIRYSERKKRVVSVSNKFSKQNLERPTNNFFSENSSFFA